MKQRLIIYYNLIGSIVQNETSKKKLFHVFTNAVEFIKIFNRGFIFIHINKTGGSTIENVLGIKEQLHLPFYAIEDYYGTSKAKQLKIATIIRNPYDRVVSQYQYRYDRNQFGIKDKKITFKEFCKGAYLNHDDNIINHPLMFKTQYEWLQCHRGSIDHIDYIGKFENFEEVIDDIIKLFGKNKKIKKIPIRRKSKRKKDWEDYYDQETKEIIYNYFKKDFIEFCYKK